ncbi:MAG: hypothetical protein U1F50_16375 [Rubrivivax sp.]
MAGASKPSAWRRWLGIAARAGHLAAVALLAAQLHGAPGAAAGGWLTLLTGLALLGAELADGRARLDELAGAWVLAKLALVAAGLAWPAAALPLFWAMLVVSAVISHAPREWRHWKPGP